MMDLDNDIFVLSEEDISILSNTAPEPVQDDKFGLMEQVVKEEREINARLTGSDEIRITTSPFVIGKDRMCDFVITSDTYISRKHCRIVRRGDDFYITDLGSTNGTYVDGIKIDTETKLEPGQEIKLADRGYIWVE